MTAWQKAKGYYFYFSVTLILLFPLASIFAQDKLNLLGNAALGYIFIDDSGNKGTTEEIFNTYSGFTLQNLNLQGIFAKNSTFELNLSNINQDNRTFLFNLRKPGLFSLNSQCNKSRFIFDEKGNIRSFRTISNVSADFQVARFLKLKGDYFHHLKEGDRRASLDGAGAWGEKYDQSFQSGGLGMQLKWGGRYLDIEYRLRSFDDEIKNLFDREGNQFKAILNTPLPSHIFLSLSYLHDKNRLKESDLNLTTNLCQGSIFYQPLRELNLSTKSLFQRTENQATGVTSDIFKVGEEIRYEFYPNYNVNLGYEYDRRKEEGSTSLTLPQPSRRGKKVEVNSFLTGFYFQFIPQLSLKARYLFQKRKDPDTLALTGPFDNERILVELKGRPLKEVNLRLRYEDKTRKNPDIFTSTKDRGFISYASLDLKDWMDIQLNYYFLKVKYKNSLKGFTVDNNTFTSMAILKPSDEFSLSVGWNHVDLRKDLDIRKDGFSLGFEYFFWEEFSFQGKYDLYTYDDYIQYLDHYGANVYTISLTRKFGGI